MSPSGVPRAGRRARSQRAGQNDERILNAASELLYEGGWDSVTLSGIAGRAGMSITPISVRYGDLAHVGAALWRQRLGVTLCQALNEVLDAAHSSDPHHALPTALHRLVHPPREIIAATDLLMAAQFDATVAEAAFADVRACLEPACVPTRSITRTHAAQSVYVVALALGLILIWKRADAVPMDIGGPIGDLCTALRHPSRPVRLPDVSRSGASPLAVRTDDEVLDDLRAATLEEVGRHGYRGATMQRIGAAARVSQGFIFGRYSSKRELFIDATASRHKAAFDAGAAKLAELQKRRGLGVAEATVMKTLMQPGLDIERAVQLEQYRLGWYDAPLEAELDKAATQYLESSWQDVTHVGGDEVPGQQHLDLALGLGVALVPPLLPEAWDLPYDVVTVPLLESREGDMG